MLVIAESGALTGAVRTQLWDLWQAAFDGRRGFSREDEEHAYGGIHVLVYDAGRILAHASVVAREIVVGERPLATGYVEGVAVWPDRQGHGLGSRVMGPLEAALRARFELGMLSTGRARGFYARRGWERWAGPSYVLVGGRRVRTEDDDDALMVLRFGPGATLDLTAPIACYDRSGDAW